VINNSGKIQLTIEKFIRISCHHISTSSSSPAAFLLGRPLMLCINAFLVFNYNSLYPYADFKDDRHDAFSI
jgi:hypothetical protein